MKTTTTTNNQQPQPTTTKGNVVELDREKMILQTLRDIEELRETLQPYGQEED